MAIFNSYVKLPEGKWPDGCTVQELNRSRKESCGVLHQEVKQSEPIGQMQLSIGANIPNHGRYCGLSMFFQPDSNGSRLTELRKVWMTILFSCTFTVVWGFSHANETIVSDKRTQSIRGLTSFHILGPSSAGNPRVLVHTSSTMSSPDC